MRYSLLRSRRGVSLVEMAIVVAIISILAAIGAGMINKTLPRWRTRQAAYELAANVSRARELAMVENTEYRVAITKFDEGPGDGVGAGTYLVQRGDAPTNSSSWDTLPVDVDGVADDGQGTFDIGEGGDHELAGVGIRMASTSDVEASTTSTDSYIIGFGPSGMTTNAASDFQCDVNGDGTADGYLCVTFDNDRALQDGRRESFTVMVSRAGLVRILAGENVDVGSPAGTATTSINTSGSSGAGYAFGGTGDPTGWGDGGSGSGAGDTGGWSGGGDTGGIPM